MNPRRSLSTRSPAFKKLLFGLGILLCLYPFSPSYSKPKASSEDPIQVIDEPTATPTEPAPTPKPVQKPRVFTSETNDKTIILHKPAIDPAWGRVIEYHKENALSAGDKAPETQYIFLFQDDQGVVRTAVYHENASGDGYWEVLVWDR